MLWSQTWYCVLADQIEMLLTHVQPPLSFWFLLDSLVTETFPCCYALSKAKMAQQFYRVPLMMCCNHSVTSSPVESEFSIVIHSGSRNATELRKNV